MGFVMRALAAAGALFLAACGPIENPRQGGGQQAGPAGLYTDASLDDFLRQRFDKVKACTGLTEGVYGELSIIMMEPVFACPWYEQGCDGEFVPPNTVKLGHPYSWSHEVIHYLLYVNTGSADTAHDSPLFTQFCPD